MACVQLFQRLLLILFSFSESIQKARYGVLLLFTIQPTGLISVLPLETSQARKALIATITVAERVTVALCAVHLESYDDQAPVREAQKKRVFIC